MTKEYWRAMLMRALWTMLEVALGYFAGVKAFPEVDWAGLFMAVVVAALTSLLKSWKVGMPEIKKGTSDEAVDPILVDWNQSVGTDIPIEPQQKETPDENDSI